MHALIIEPMAFTACAIEDALRDAGFDSFDFAIDADEAVAAAASHRPDLVTSAFELDSGCGVAAVERICAGQPVPAIFVTHEIAEVRRRRPDALIVAKQPFRAEDVAAAAVAARPFPIA